MFTIESNHICSSSAISAALDVLYNRGRGGFSIEEDLTHWTNDELIEVFFNFDKLKKSDSAVLEDRRVTLTSIK